MSRSPAPIRTRVVALVLVALALVATAGAQDSAPVAATDATLTGTLRLYVARHGESAYNAENRVQGQLDIPLTARGREQAARLGDALRGARLDAVYTSTLTRNRETARIAVPTTTAVALDELKERHQGKFQGLPATDAEFRRRSANPDDDMDGGETTAQLEARVRMALARIRREHPTGEVLIVGHALTNQMILRVLLDVPVADAVRIAQQNEELYLVELRESAVPRLWKLIRPSNLGDL